MIDDSTHPPVASLAEPAPPLFAPTEPAIVDAWRPTSAIPLTGWLERSQFHPLFAAFLVFVVAFLLFQLVVAPIVLAVGVAIDVIQNGDGQAPDMGMLLEQLQTNGRLMLTANTIGQFLGFGLFALLVAKLHSPATRAYLRIRQPDGPGLGLAALGWAALYPAVLWTGQLNERVPMPDWLRTLEQQQVDMIEGLLLGSDLSTGFLFFALAITPALCEEVLFRGYLQRQVERGWGTVASIVVVGILFGLYHLRLSQAVPLSLLGIYLGFVVWATGSLWAGVLVHLLNNGLAVAVTAFARDSPDLDLETIEAAGVPWYVGVAGLVSAAVLMRVLAARRRTVVGDAPDSLPVEVPSLSTPSPLPLPS